MKIESMSVGLLVGLLSVGCSQFGNRRASFGDGGAPERASATVHDDDDDDDDDDDQEIALVDVPTIVSQAALSAVPGLVLTSAEIEDHNGSPIYSLEGEAAGEAWCVEVSPTGEVLETEQEGDDDDDDDDEGEDD